MPLPAGGPEQLGFEGSVAADFAGRAGERGIAEGRERQVREFEAARLAIESRCKGLAARDVAPGLERRAHPDPDHREAAVTENAGEGFAERFIES